MLDDPAWSPDGRTIAVCKLSAEGDDHVGTLEVVDVRSGDARTVMTPDDRLDVCSGPRWSPDGTRIVLELVHRDGTGLVSEVVAVTLAVLDVRTPNRRPRPLADPKLFAVTADWSPDGRTIVYSALPEPTADNTDLYAIDPDGGDAKRLTTLADEGSAASQPSFDADGRSVVFVSSASSSLMRVDAGGGDVATAFPTKAGGQHPRARPRPRRR